MTWTILVPHCSRDERLTATAGHCRRLGPDGAVMREVVLAVRLDGLQTAGQLLDRLAGMGPAHRRRLLDQARVRAGRESASAVDERARVEMASTAARARMAADQRPLRLGYSPSGAIIDLNEQDDERQRIESEQESRRCQHEERLTVAQVEAEALRQSEQARDAAMDRLLPEHLRPRPA